VFITKELLEEPEKKSEKSQLVQLVSLRSFKSSTLETLWLEPTYSIKLHYIFLSSFIGKCVKTSEVREAVTVVTLVILSYVQRGLWISSSAKLIESDFQMLLGARYRHVDKAKRTDTLPRRLNTTALYNTRQSQAKNSSWNDML
jgi:hypothetical protein